MLRNPFIFVYKLGFIYSNMAENRNYPVISGGSLPYRISTKSIEISWNTRNKQFVAVFVVD
jgi:hypothetical protein